MSGKTQILNAREREELLANALINLHAEAVRTGHELAGDFGAIVSLTLLARLPRSRVARRWNRHRRIS